MSKLQLTVASWADRDDLVIELTTGEGAATEDWGLVTYDPDQGKPVIDLYPRANDGEWHFDLDEVNTLLARAKDRIMEVAGPIASEQPGAASASDDPSSGTPTRSAAPVGARSVRTGLSPSLD